MDKRKKIIIPIITILLIILFAIGFSIRREGCSNVQISAAVRDEVCTELLILSPGIPLAGTPEGDLSKAILKEINSYRKSNGLTELTWSEELEDCSRVRAEEITQKWSHTRPDGSDWYTVNEDIMWGENLAKGLGTGNDIVTAWKNSPSHNENLLNADFRYVAISINGSYIACEFCY